MTGGDRKALFIDLHADTLFRILERGLDARAFLEGEVGPPGAPEEALHVEIPGAKASGVDALVLAAFVEGPRAGEMPIRPSAQDRAPPGGAASRSSPEGALQGSGDSPRGLRAGLEMVALLKELEGGSRGAARQALSARDIIENRERGALSLVLSLENAGDLAEGSLKVLEDFRRLGARLAGLVWYARNAFGSGVGEGSDAGGLSLLGREAVRALGKMAVAVDVSHLNPTGFRDALEAAAGPVVATHSNARAVCDHPRNLTDDQIREIAARGGVVGLCLFPKFLRDPSKGDATVEDAARHLERIAEVGGIGCIASGSDFDGCARMVGGISGVRDLPRIAEALRGRGWREEEIAAWRGENAFRVLEMLGE